MVKLIRYFLLWLSLSSLIHCTTFPFELLAPQMSIMDFKIIEIGLLEQHCLLRLRLKNPHPFPLPITGLNYQIYINNKELTRGNNQQPVTLSAFGEEVLELKIKSNLWQVVDKWPGWNIGLAQHFNYRLVGGVYVSHSPTPISLEYQGQVTLGWKEK